MYPEIDVNQPAPPPKLFREEAKTGAVQCPACGAPITLRGFGGIEQVTCSYCGTTLEPEPDGALEIIQQAARQRRPSMLPLYARGEFEGATWEIIGITWREVVAEGMTFPWQEFLLFNPYLGYRWLIYSMSDGVWSIGGPLPGAAKLEPGMWPKVHWAGEAYKHYTGGAARTTYVEGEFPWQVLVGDVAQTNDYVCPPKQISIEVQQTQRGTDVNFTLMQPLPAREVWAAFKLPGEPPPETGIHPAAPNPVAANTRFFVLSAALLFVLWVIATIAYSSSRDNAQVWSGTIRPGEVISQEITIGEPGKSTTLDVELRAAGMNNSWAYADVLLINPKTEEALALGVDVEWYSGVEGGESWSEGHNPNSQKIGGVEGGTYLLQINPQFDPGGDPADSITLTIKRDVPLTRYVFLPLLVILAFPLVHFIRRAAFEKRRWANSDHAPVTSDE